MRQNIISGGSPAGFIEYITAADELQITDIYVRPEYRRQGLAAQALGELFAENKTLAHAYLEVRASNTAAQNLYVKLGFAKTGLRKNYYSNPAEDAVLLRKSLTPLS
jgi:ribosomal-protein-alanine N-acetyltransferase